LLDAVDWQFDFRITFHRPAFTHVDVGRSAPDGGIGCGRNGVVIE
jgi:hypothetical protein